MHKPVSDHRKSRCTGTALQVAAGLVDAVIDAGSTPARIMLFVGGPCTEGVFAEPAECFVIPSSLPEDFKISVADGCCPGRAAMVNKELTKEIRAHKDLEKDAAPLWRPSVQFFVELTETLVKSNVCLDVFACALEQSGLAEMKPAIQATGGFAVQTDTFRNPVFKDSLTRVFAKVNEEGFAGRCACASIQVHVSRDLKVAVRFLCNFCNKPFLLPWCNFFPCIGVGLVCMVLLLL